MNIEKENISLWEILSAKLRLLNWQSENEVCGSIRYEVKMQAKGYEECMADLAKYCGDKIK